MLRRSEKCFSGRRRNKGRQSEGHSEPNEPSYRLIDYKTDKLSNPIRKRLIQLRMTEMKMPHTFLPQQRRLRNPLWDYRIPDADLSRSQRVIADSQTLMDQSYKASERMEEDINKKLEQRIQDVRMWRQELHKKLEEIVQEIDVLVTLRTRMEWAIESCSEALQITLQCLAEREKNVGIVCDEVERELMKERELIQRVILRLQSTLKQNNEQIRLSRSAKYYLERDLQDKLQAEQIDGCCSGLRKTAPKQLYTKEPNLNTSGSTVTPKEWDNFTNVNLSRVEQERKNSMSLRATLSNMLEQMAADIRRQNQAAGNVLEQNIQDNKSAKEQIEDSLAKVLADIESQDRNMVSLRITIEAKKGLIGVAQTQLAVRSQRPRKELCQDPAQVQLLAEVQEHSAYIKRLSGYLSQAEMELRALTRTQLFLEQKIQDKSLFLDIDQAIYTQLCQTIAVYTF